MGSQAAYLATFTGDGGSGQVLTLLLSNRADEVLCPASADRFANLQRIEVVLVSASGPVTPGTYPIHLHAMPDATLYATDASCNVTSPLDAGVSGTFTLSQVNASSVSGSFDITFDATQGSFSASFDAPVCNGMIQIGDGGAACQ